MARTYTKIHAITLSNSEYTGATGTGQTILQTSEAGSEGVGNNVLNIFQGPRVTVDTNASGIVFFPAIGALPAGARITMDFQVEYGARDVTAVNRLLTWTRDSVVVETNEEFGSFSFDTSCTVARVGTETCYITPIYTIRA